MSLVLLLGVAGWALDEQTASAPIDPAHGEFQKQVRAYAELRAKACKDLPKLKEQAEPEEIKRQQEEKRAKIAGARVEAKEGLFFPEPVAKSFRQILHAEFRGTDGKSARLAVMESNPGRFECKVNAPYPPDAPVSTVPPDLLLKLPPLPEYLEYRFVGLHLILRDTEANMIVDCLKNAIR